MSKNQYDQMPTGWYWVRFDQGNCDLTEPIPALWDGEHWRSVGWSGQSLHEVLHLEQVVPHGEDPLQGAADWICIACEKPDVALIQQKLMIGYNRASRLFAKAVKNAANTNN